jgi:hypothetical protein
MELLYLSSLHLKYETHKLKYDVDLCVCHFWSVTLRSYGKLCYELFGSTKDKTRDLAEPQPTNQAAWEEKKINGFKIYSYVQTIVCYDLS